MYYGFYLGDKALNGVRYQTQNRNERRQIRKMIASERFYERNFALFEFGFIFFVIPMLVLSFVSVPFLYFYILTKEFLVWPFIVLFTLIVFIQIMAIQYFVRRFYLEPNNMSLGEYLRFKYDKRKEKQERVREGYIPEATWYENMDDFHFRLKQEMREQSDQLFSQYKNQYKINDK